MLSFAKKITELLLEKKVLTAEGLENIFAARKGKKVRLSNLLLESGVIKKETLNALITGLFDIKRSSLLEIKVHPELLSILSLDTARQYSIFPVALSRNNLILALTDPFCLLDVEEIKELESYEITAVVIAKEDLTLLMQKYYPEVLVESSAARIEDILNEVSDISAKREEELDNARLADGAQEMPIIRATNFILSRAIELKASDILIEPLDRATRVRFRIDGMWRQVESLPARFNPFIISRIKVIADLDIAEHRLPQEGQFKIKLNNKAAEIRVSVFPCINGEKIVMRILDKTLGLLDIDMLGLREEELLKLKKAIYLPHGMILTCGPTGSGKTTTLYSMLKQVNTEGKNIITVEDPVEYEIKGINQVSINLKTGLTFARALRSILRQDPDIIMIGEIRDSETINIAIKAALTGHLVFSTLHTTTAAGTIIRLIDMKVEPFLVNASLIAIISQRLARRICDNCKTPIEKQPYFYGRGCKECLQTGYKGRLLITEILHMSSKIREAIISKRFDENEIKEISRAEGMKTLREEGLYQAQAGIVSWEEVLRVTPAD